MPRGAGGPGPGEDSSRGVAIRAGPTTPQRRLQRVYRRKTDWHRFPDRARRRPKAAARPNRDRPSRCFPVDRDTKVTAC